MIRRTALVCLLWVVAGAGLTGVLALRGTPGRPDAIDADVSGVGPWAQVTLRVEGMY